MKTPRKTHKWDIIDDKCHRCELLRKPDFQGKGYNLQNAYMAAQGFVYSSDKGKTWFKGVTSCI